VAEPTPGLRRVLDLLLCPRCGGHPLTAVDGAVRCPRGHAFDLARQGYLSLLAGARATSGDDAEMARARERFLTTGAYDAVRAALVEAAVAALPADGAVLDVGCGTGWYAAGLLDAAPGARGLGLDTSARSLRAAARAHPRLGAVGWDVLAPYPLGSRSVDVVLDVFSPRNPPQMHRVLRPGGRLVVARPGPGHLAELRAAVPGMVAVDPAKEDRLSRALDDLFVAGPTEVVEQTVPLAVDQARDLVGMTPSARHVEAAALTSDGLPDSVSVSVLVGAYSLR